MTASMTGAEITEAKATQPQNSSKKLLLDIAIVGGGIAGLATAAALRQAGHKITVNLPDAESMSILVFF